MTFTPEQMTITSIPGPDRSIKTADLKRLRLLSKGDRNRRIGEFLKELDLAEARNTGYPVILSAAEKNGSPKPVLETNAHRDFFTFVLPIHKMFLRADAETVRELNPADTMANPVGDPVGDPVSDPAKIKWLGLVKVLADGPRTAAELRGQLAVSHRKFFRDNYINPAIRNGYIVPEEGVSLHNPHLRYFITQKGRDALKRHERV